MEWGDLHTSSPLCLPPRAPLWHPNVNFWNTQLKMAFPVSSDGSGRAKPGFGESHFVINYFLGPLNDAVCHMERVMRWKAWSTTRGVIRSILLLTVSWLLWQHHCSRALWLWEGWQEEFVAAFGSLVLKNPQPGVVLSLFLPVNGENTSLPF